MLINIVTQHFTLHLCHKYAFNKFVQEQINDNIIYGYIIY